MGIGHVEKLVGVALALMAFIAPVSAQITLPEIDVSWTRLNSGMVGTSNSVITSQDIERSPAQNLPDILLREVGIQIQHLLSSTNGSRDGVDLRGFGAFAQSNVLILVNGRRYQDFDLQGFDFSSIPLNSIERIEITRGNSSTVLYGDGAIGGSINIVLKKGSSTAAVNRVDGLAGSFNFWEGRASAAVTSGPWSVGAFGNAIDSNGYRVNSALRQRNVNATLNYATPNLGGISPSPVIVSFKASRQASIICPAAFRTRLRRPGNQYAPRLGQEAGHRFCDRVQRDADPGVELIVDGGVRRKFQQAQFFNYFDPVTFLYNVNAATPMNYVDTVMTTSSVTPRLDTSHHLFGVPNRLFTGIDFYNTQYHFDRPTTPGLVPIHSYDIRQTTQLSTR